LSPEKLEKYYVAVGEGGPERVDKCLLTVEVEVLEQKNPEIEEEYLRP
jgi:hypothetical protein